MGNIGWSEFLVIALIALVFFGPSRLPEIANAIGKSLRQFRRALNEVRDEIQQAGGYDTGFPRNIGGHLTAGPPETHRTAGPATGPEARSEPSSEASSEPTSEGASESSATAAEEEAPGPNADAGDPEPE